MTKPSQFTVVPGSKPEDTDSPASKFGDENIAVLNADTIAELKKKQLLREVSQDIELPPFSAGMERIGQLLTDEERMVFCEVCTLDAVLEDWVREITARTHEKLAQHVRTTAGPKEAAENFIKDMVFTSDDEAEEYFSEVYRREYLDALFWFNLRQRLGMFGANLAICHGFSVARVGYKYKIGNNV